MENSNQKFKLLIKYKEEKDLEIVPAWLRKCLGDLFDGNHCGTQLVAWGNGEAIYNIYITNDVNISKDKLRTLLKCTDGRIELVEILPNN